MQLMPLNLDDHCMFEHLIQCYINIIISRVIDTCVKFIIQSSIDLIFFLLAKFKSNVSAVLF